VCLERAAGCDAMAVDTAGSFMKDTPKASLDKRRHSATLTGHCITFLAPRNNDCLPRRCMLREAFLTCGRSAVVVRFERRLPLKFSSGWLKTTRVSAPWFPETRVSAPWFLVSGFWFPHPGFREPGFPQLMMKYEL
jgi:hypothetical protein